MPQFQSFHKEVFARFVKLGEKLAIGAGRIAGLLEPADVSIQRTRAGGTKALGFGGGRFPPSPLFRTAIGKREGSAISVSSGRTIWPGNDADGKDSEVAIINAAGTTKKILGIGLFIEEKKRIRWPGAAYIAKFKVFFNSRMAQGSEIRGLCTHHTTE